MEKDSYENMLNLAKELAIESGKLSLRMWRSATATRKADHSIVTDADCLIQEMILDALAQEYPHHSVIAEEMITTPDKHAQGGESRYCWVIDPIDGTRNYVSGIPCFGTSIAIMDRGIPVVGVVTDHNQDVMFTAVSGKGAFWGDRRLSLDQVAEGRDHLVGVPSSKNPFDVGILQEWVAEPEIVLRNLGSSVLHLAYVASGGLDAAFSAKSKIWDVAAGVLMVTEAGGITTCLEGKDPFPFDTTTNTERSVPIMAACPELHEKLMRAVERARSRQQGQSDCN